MISWDKLQQILQVFVKAMGALFTAHFNHKCLLFLYWNFIVLSQMLKHL